MLLILMSVLLIRLSQAKGPPQISSAYTKNHLVRSGDSLKLTCPINSNPTALIGWEKDGEAIHLGWERFRPMDGVLRVKDMEEDDTGVYVCKATNGFGSVDVKFLVYAYTPETNGSTVIPNINFEKYFPESSTDGEAPYFRPDQNIQMKESVLVQISGSSVRLRCRASGRPKPDMVWYKDGSIYPEEDAPISSAGNPETWILKLTNLKPSDSGHYSCRAFNRAGSINFTYAVHVIEYNSKPLIMDLQNFTIFPGDSAILQCEVYSDEMPGIKWLKRIDSSGSGRTSLQNSSITQIDNQPYLILPDTFVMQPRARMFVSKLSLHNVGVQNSGVYVCAGASSWGVTYRTAFVSVVPFGTVDTEYVPPPANHGDQKDSSFVPIIVTLSAIVCLVILILVIIVIRRRHLEGQQLPKSSSSTTSVPVQRSNMATTSSVCSSNEKQFDHRYAVLNQHSEVPYPGQPHSSPPSSTFPLLETRGLPQNSQRYVDPRQNVQQMYYQPQMFLQNCGEC